MLRNAHVDDVEEMSRLINQFAKKDLMLPRPLSELYEKIRDYYVYVENGSIKGCAALHVFWKDLAVFVLTYIPEFFEYMGFKRIDKELLPHKIWSECVKCYKFPDCGEVPLIIEI
jgi:amino-acid N-acetyltransferase